MEPFILTAMEATAHIQGGHFDCSLSLAINFFLHLLAPTVRVKVLLI
jgi:hypothetical protein